MFQPIFPTVLHEAAANRVTHFFMNANVDTVLVVNSCARGQAVPESDLDMAILVNEATLASEIKELNKRWLQYSSAETIIQQYKKSTPFAHLHIDIINGRFLPETIENGEPIDYFEVVIGNQVCYAMPMHSSGMYFKKLQEKWLPYYEVNLRLERLKAITNACLYDLDHIPYLLKRELYFHAFEILYKAFQEYLMALFIANKTYPIAYNKWIKYQVVDLLKKPDLYPLLSPVLSITDIESNEVNDKADLLYRLLNDLPKE